MNRRALIIVDLQKDFMPGGALAVPGGDEIVPEVNRMLLLDERKQWELVVATKDWHPEAHCSFKDQGGPWPAHCVRNTPGAEFNDALVFGEDRADVVTTLHKGEEVAVDSYSAFSDNARAGDTRLNDLLKMYRIDEIFVCGLATDYCVRCAVLDARDLRIPTTVLLDACRAVNVKPLDEKNALVEMVKAGAKLTIVDKVFR